MLKVVELKVEIRDVVFCCWAKRRASAKPNALKSAKATVQKPKGSYER